MRRFALRALLVLLPLMAGGDVSLAQDVEEYDLIAVIPAIKLRPKDERALPLREATVGVRQRLGGWFDLVDEDATVKAVARFGGGPPTVPEGADRALGIGRSLKVDYVFAVWLSHSMDGPWRTVHLKAYDARTGRQDGPWSAHFRRDQELPGALDVLLRKMELLDDDAAVGPPPRRGDWPYPVETRSRFTKLMATPEWSVASPPRNPQGMLEADHRKTGLCFVLVPTGSFEMGAVGWRPHESPVHRVTVPAYLACVTECTQRAFDAVGGDDGREWKGPDLPIENVTWIAARDWCAKAGLRLPSEAEWEYACRAGSRGDFCWGHDPRRLSEHAWFEGTRKTNPARQKKPNAWGLFDVHGNVFEWCADAWHESYEGAPMDGSARIAERAEKRVERGGSWGMVASVQRCAFRLGTPAVDRDKTTGFRPAASLPPR